MGKNLTKSVEKQDSSHILETNTLFTKVLANIPALVVVYRIDTGEYIYVSDAIRKILGYEPQAFLKGGLSFVAPLVHPNDLPRIIEENNKALKKANSKKTNKTTNNPIVTFEYRMRHKDGTWKWLHSDGVVFEREKSGKVISVMNISVDITARKEHELTAMHQLQTVNTQVQDIFESISDGFAAFDKRWHFVYVNKNIEHVLGKKRQQLLGKNIWREYPQAVGTSLYQKYRQAMKSNEPTVFEEYSVISKRWFRIHATPTKDGLSIYAADITDRKLAENALRRSQAQFQAIYDANIIGILHCDLSGTIFDANDAFLRMIGYTRKDLKMGKLNWDDLTPKEHSPSDEKAVSELLSKGVATLWEKEYIRKDGTRIPVIAGAALLNKETTETIAFVFDITERKQHEQRKDEFISIASHELKTPITSIKAFTQLLSLQAKKDGDGKTAPILQRMDDQLNRLTKLVNDLLDVSRIQTGKLALNKETFSLDALVEEIVANIQPLSKTHKIIVTGTIGTKVYADKDRIDQVLTNLINNAIAYSPKANKIVIGLKKVSANAEVFVQDYGIGIAKDYQEKIFDRFYRTPEAHNKLQGQGLGLYIVSEIIKRHHGIIHVESEINKGSTFRFTIPIR